MTVHQKDIIVAKHARPLCQSDSPLQITGTKLFKRSSLRKALSEYQSAYKGCPWQPVRQCLKPVDESTKNIKSVEKVRPEMFRKSTYGQDYVGYPVPKQTKPKKHKTSLTMPDVSLDTSTTYKVEYYAKSVRKPEPINTQHDTRLRIPMSAEDIEFQGSTIYQASYPAHDKETIISCHVSPVKAKENIVIPFSRDADKNPRSTAQVDFVHHENVQPPALIYPQENRQISTDPLDSSTEYKDFYTDKSKELTNNIMVVVKTDDATSSLGIPISTVMTDYKDPMCTQPPKAIRHKAQGSFMPVKLDWRTTSNLAYKEWPVQPYELPIWARKPIYKRPKSGILTNSLYAHDYTHPKMISEDDLMVRNAAICHEIIPGGEGDVKYKPMSTYKGDYRRCETAGPPKSYRVTEKYKAPKEKMVCDTNHRSHFKGMPSPKMQPCRHPSQHRELNTNKRMSFMTTYKANYQDPRPKSTPICNSSPEVIPRAPGSAKVRGSIKMPHVEMTTIPACNVNMLTIAKPTAAPPNTPDNKPHGDVATETKSSRPGSKAEGSECEKCEKAKECRC